LLCNTFKSSFIRKWNVSLNMRKIFSLIFVVLVSLPLFWWAHDHMVVGFITTNVPMQSVPIIANVVSSNPSQTRCSQYIKSMYFKFLYRISGNVCGFWLKKKAFNFCRFFPLRIENLGTEKKLFVWQEATTEAMLW
jgi:hypothetical protein